MTRSYRFSLATGRDAHYRTARADAGTLALKVDAVGKCEITIALTPCERTAGRALRVICTYWEGRVMMETSSLNAAGLVSALRSIGAIVSALTMCALLAYRGAALGQTYPSKMTLERFARFIRTESARWGKVIRERNIRAQ